MARDTEAPIRRSGDAKHADLARTTWEKAEKPIARDGLVIGRRTFTADQLKAELERPVQMVRVSTALSEWPMRYGNAYLGRLYESSLGLRGAIPASALLIGLAFVWIPICYVGIGRTLEHRSELSGEPGKRLRPAGRGSDQQRTRRREGKRPQLEIG